MLRKGKCLKSASDLLSRAEAELYCVPFFPYHPAAGNRNSKWGLNQTSIAPGFSSLTSQAGLHLLYDSGPACVG